MSIAKQANTAEQEFLKALDDKLWKAAMFVKIVVAFFTPQPPLLRGLSEAPACPGSGARPRPCPGFG